MKIKWENDRPFLELDDLQPGDVVRYLNGDTVYLVTKNALVSLKDGQTFVSKFESKFVKLNCELVIHGEMK